MSVYGPFKAHVYSITNYAPVNVMPWGRMGNAGDSDERPFYTPRDSGMTLLSNTDPVEF